MRAIRQSLTSAAVIAVAALALTACGGSSSSSSSSESAATEASVAADASSAAPEDASGGDAAAAGEVPDPCTLLDGSELTSLAGADPGAGEMTTFDPAARKICTFSNGMILAVEIADNYDVSVDKVKETAPKGSTKEVSGLGEKALVSDYGQGISQVLILQGPYFVGVTGPVTVDQSTAIAQAMVAALG